MVPLAATALVMNNSGGNTMGKSSAADDVRERLAQAKKMLDDGVISASEYEVMRANIIKDM